MDESKSDSNKWRRWFLEYCVIAGLLALLYFTGWYVEVVGKLQEAVIWTGLMQPKLEQRIDYDKHVDLDMPLVSLSGEHTNLNTYHGKVIFLNFWATWCAPCVAEMPNIESLYRKYEDDPDVIFIMVSRDEDQEKARSFIQKKEFTFPVYLPAENIPSDLWSRVIPTTFVINKQGQIAIYRQGMAKYDTDRFRTFLDSLAHADLNSNPTN